MQRHAHPLPLNIVMQVINGHRKLKDICELKLSRIGSCTQKEA